MGTGCPYHRSLSRSVRGSAWATLGSCKITSRDDNHASVWNSIPRFVKILVLVQSLANLFMGFWIYQEYLNNPYLQSYVNGFFRGSLGAIILGLTGLSAIVVVGLYAKLRGARRKLYGMRSTGTGGSDRGRRGGSLDERTEQHLIAMIRKTQGITNSGTSDELPTLRRIDPQSPGE
jgi:hypothetical protein